MLRLLKRLLILVIILLILYVIFADNGLENIKNTTKSIINKQPSNTSVSSTSIETQNLKEDPWSNVDNPVPEEFDSGYMPGSGLKSKLKKFSEKMGKDEYGYK